MIGIVERLSDRLLNRVLPEVSAKAAGICTERCYCFQDPDQPWVYYEVRRDCDCTSGVCGACYGTLYYC